MICNLDVHLMLGIMRLFYCLTLVHWIALEIGSSPGMQRTPDSKPTQPSLGANGRLMLGNQTLIVTGVPESDLVEIQIVNYEGHLYLLCSSQGCPLIHAGTLFDGSHEVVVTYLERTRPAQYMRSEK